MLSIIFAWLYITPLCWIWGFGLQDIFCRVLKIEKFKPYTFAVTCFLGLSALAIVSSLLSLVIPLGGLLAQFLLLLPALAIFIFNKQVKAYFRQQLREIFDWNNRYAAFICLLTLLLVLIMNAWQITHPDTLGYHLQTAKWIENYPAVPGIALLNIRLGYQGLWYILCAVFSFGFTGTVAPTFINSTLAMWYLLFVLKGVDNGLSKNKPGNTAASLLYFLLLGITLFDYGQLRLMVTSLSPDFVACLYLLLIFHLFLKKEPANPVAVSRLLVFFLCLVAISIKLSVIPIFVFSIFQGYKLIAAHGRKMMFFLVFLLIICLAPFFARNIISSGYPAFPSVFPNPINTEWQITEQKTRLEKDYIKAYARIGAVSGENTIQQVANSPLNYWMPAWWKQKVITEKIILVSCLLSILIFLWHAKTSMKNLDIALPLLTCLTGIVFWFINAPDPRFAYGFLLIPQGFCLWYFILQKGIVQKYSNKIVQAGLVTGTIIILGYMGHRLAHFFKPQELIYPAGAQVVPYKTIRCHTCSINVPLEGFGSGNIALPCSISEDCNEFELRTNDIKDGFKTTSK